MKQHIALIQGHPDPEPSHFAHALATAYAEGARDAGHDVHTLTVADMDFPLLRTKQAFEREDPPPAIREAQAAIDKAGHLVIIYPLWLGDMPAVLKGFMEQVFRPGFAYRMDDAGGGQWHRHLKGKTARVVVTMGMPAAIYRWYFRAHSLKSLERNILKFVGIGPVRPSLIGQAERLSASRRQAWLDRMRSLGRNAR